MTKLAIAAPSKVGIGPLMTGTVAQDSVSVNQWNLEALSVNEKHIAPASITTEKLVIGSVTSVTIADGTITGDKVAAATITGNKIAANTIEGGNIKASTITSGLINVSTLSAISANMGTITAGTLNLVDGANTGIYLSPTQVLAKVAGVTKLNFDVVGGTYYVKGEIVADKVTITSNAANSVTFGADITINGNIIMNTANSNNQISFGDTSNFSFISYTTATGRAALSAKTSIQLVAQGGFGDESSLFLTRGGSAVLGGYTTVDISANQSVNITIPNSASYYLYVKNASATTLLSIKGSTGLVTCSGFLSAVGISSSAGVYGAHKTTAGAALADGTYTAFGISLTVVDGLIVSQTGFTVS